MTENTKLNRRQERSKQVLAKYGLEPDPVIEYYKAKIDRAEIRRNLKLTPDERCEKLLQRQREAAASKPSNSRKTYRWVPSDEDLKIIDEAVKARKLARYGLEPMPIVEAYKKDVDRSLIRENLRRSVEERMQNLLAMQEFALATRQARQKERTKQLQQSLNN